MLTTSDKKCMCQAQKCGSIQGWIQTSIAHTGDAELKVFFFLHWQMQGGDELQKLPELSIMNRKSQLLSCQMTVQHPRNSGPMRKANASVMIRNVLLLHPLWPEAACKVHLSQIAAGDPKHGWKKKGHLLVLSRVPMQAPYGKEA